jgi:DNA-binding response OmpR family regulator
MTIQSARVLVVDDQFGNRDSLETFLQREGYITESAATGEHALRLVAQRAPDLILLDITMPGMDGFEVARRLKSDPATAAIPIILVTAHTSGSARLVGLEAGAEDYLTKPFNPSELALKVRNLLRLKANAQASD